ncbi:F0F1 ATP synthase subunit B [Parvularcula dongshanensis]|uniref:ATP synthase subunit b n=1 Tax=Parvularcula dongshanensis TaxID=1173995 RepID=A0A840I3A3_9PROT|nr:F0F1 ATP synthase subunit B [Parvularcula dongshanensis]MBB4658753.1 F-type H+-transporting ATPase subunit b [Parvularcula dongshanensis]
MQEQHDLQNPNDDFVDDVRDELTLDDGTLVDSHAQVDDHSAHGAWYEDTNLWVLVAFLLVLGLLAWQGVHRKVGGALGARSDRIRGQLDEARSLREEAQRLLAEYQKRQREAEEEAKSIIEQAKDDAKIMTSDARVHLDEQLARRTRAAEDRIARAEAQAIADVRGHAADLAVAAARRIIAEKAADGRDPLIDRAISDVAVRLG